jgi:hypothetical protein
MPWKYSTKAIKIFIYYILFYCDATFFFLLSRKSPSGMFPFTIGFRKCEHHTYFVGFPGLGSEPSQSLYLHKTAQHRKRQICIPARRRIRNHDPGVRVTEHSKRHTRRPRAQRGRRLVVITIKNSVSGLRKCSNRSTPAETSFWCEELLYPYHTGATVSTTQWTLFLVRGITVTTTHYWSPFLVSGTAV